MEVKFFKSSHHLTISSVILATLLTGSITSAQDETYSIITDRPDRTESAVTVPLHSFQIETGFLFQHDKSSVPGAPFEIQNFSLGSTLFRYGILPWAEFRLGGEYLIEKETAGVNTTTTGGMSGVFAGGKLHLLSGRTSGTDIALLLHARLPIGEAGFRPTVVEPEAIAAIGHQLSDRFSLTYNLGASFPDADAKKVVGLYSVALGISLAEQVGGFLEVFGSTSPQSSITYQIDGGVTYLFTPDIQIDASVGYAISTQAPDWFAGLGISVRIPRL